MQPQIECSSGATACSVHAHNQGRTPPLTSVYPVQDIAQPLPCTAVGTRSTAAGVMQATAAAATGAELVVLPACLTDWLTEWLTEYLTD